MTTSGPKLSKSMIETAGLLAEAARTSTMDWFRKPVEVDSKSDATPVTQADRDTELRLKQIISERHPGHSVVGEEYGLTGGDEPWQWIIDPIDGTKCFATGEPTFGCLIALTRDNKPVLGIIEMPALQERWVGITGLPTVLNGRPCRACGATVLADASVQASTPDMFNEHTRPAFDHLCANTRFRNFGTDCYGYALVASGYADIVMEADLKAYDYMAVIPVIEGAGGVISDWEGNALSTTSGGNVLACANPKLHEQALRVINS